MKKTVYESSHKHSVFDNLLYVFRMTWRIDPHINLSAILQIPFVVATPLLMTYLSAEIVRMLENNVSPDRFIIMILLMFGTLLMCNLIAKRLGIHSLWRSYAFRFSFRQIFYQKIMDTDYSNIESPLGQNKMGKVLVGSEDARGPLQNIMNSFVAVFTNLIGLITYTAILWTLNPWIVLMILLMTAVNFAMNRSFNLYEHRTKPLWSETWRKNHYITVTAKNLDCAKDIRLYKLKHWFRYLFDENLSDRVKLHKKHEKKLLINGIVTALCAFLRDGVAYGYLIYKVVHADLSAADFVWFFTIIGAYSGYFYGLANESILLHKESLYYDDVRDFLSIPDHSNRGEGMDIPSSAPEIVFEHVSFRYPGAEKDTLHDLNFHIKKGEKIAIVGLNGAGKTTLIKLLCGLYRPSEGTITVDGKTIDAYNRDEYYRLFSVVFQDILLLPLTVEENIALCSTEDVDKHRLMEVLQKAGLYEKVMSLPNGEKTYLVKTVNDNAVGLSGGEIQKLALARALYRGGKILVLDEPTAALDPIAENEIYQIYDSLTSTNTSVYISHRLSSTRFCDRIFFLKDGGLSECGSHDALMKQDGDYAAMFKIQSQYYTEVEDSEA